MAEICSVYPVAGSVYYWSGALAKKQHSAFASYMTGWLNFFACIAFTSSFTFGLSRIIVGFVRVNEVFTLNVDQ